MELNQAQQKAVDHKTGPLLIIAGAGTGKTAVITQRILNIINQQWAKPSEILALTFTEKAAREMMTRVDVAMPFGYEEVMISTFHSFCDRTLKQDGIFLGLDPNYKLMTESEAYVFFRKHIFEMPLDTLRPLGNPGSFVTQILSHFSRLQDEDVKPDDYIKYAKNLSEDDEDKANYKQQIVELAETFKFYTELKIKESRLDFGDLINMVLKLFRERPNILKKYHDRYKYVLVDEFQDTNYTQNVLVNMIALGKEPDTATEKERKEANITVVGDDDQAIYKFRGAAISNILQFKELYKTAERVVLTENYRSKQEILDAAYRVIQNNNPYRLEVTESVSKKLEAKADDKVGEKDIVKLILAKSGSEEADRVAKVIDELVKGKQYKYEDIAILVRANSHSDDFVQALRYRGIPYKFSGYRGLYNTDEVRLLISYLRLLADYEDSISLFNVINLRLFGFTPREIVELMKYSRKEKSPLFTVLENLTDGENKAVFPLRKMLSDNALTSIAKIVKIINRGFDLVKEGKGVGQILYEFFDKSGWKDSLIEDESPRIQSKVEYIRKYFDMLTEFERNNPGTSLYEYLDYLDYSIEIGENPNISNDVMTDVDAVNILTVHGSKGLEFPVVFLVNLVSERFPTRMKSERLAIPDDMIKEVVPEDNPTLEHIQEERRLFYVGVTRAKEKLYLSAAQSYSGAGRIRKVSGFLNETLGRDVNEDINNLKEVETKEVEFQVYQRQDTADIIDYKKLGLEPSTQFSYSQIVCYELCPRQYKYSYVLRIPSPPHASLSFGNTIHNTLRTFYERSMISKQQLEGFVDKPTLDDMNSLYGSYWQSAGYDSKEHERRRFESGKKILKNFYEKMFSEKDMTIFVEKGFKYAIEDFRVLGKVDRVDVIGEENGKKIVEIIDYKTGKAKSQKDANREWQLIFYSLVAEELWGVKVGKASYIYIEHNKKVEVNVTDRRKKNVIKKIVNIVGKIRSGDFTVPKSHQCSYCDYQDICEDTVL